MAKYSMKRDGKEVGPASVYAEPHTMSGKKINKVDAGAANQKKNLRDTEVSVGNSRSGDYKPVKTSGIKIRGTGAATKGVMARGPMG